MTRRTFIQLTSAAIAAATAGLPEGVHGQDLEFIAALERAQAQRPASFGARSRIAPPGEPGVPLVVHGRAIAEDGVTPIAGAIVFAYHTDKDGHYDRPGSGPHSWRLKGWARTDADGRFEFTTIRPGPYPGRQTAAHIHLNIFLPDGRRYWAAGLEFDDDRLVTESSRTQSRQRGTFGGVTHVRHEGSTQVIDFHFRLYPENRF